MISVPLYICNPDQNPNNLNRKNLRYCSSDVVRNELADRKSDVGDYLIAHRLGAGVLKYLAVQKDRQAVIYEVMQQLNTLKGIDLISYCTHVLNIKVPVKTTQENLIVLDALYHLGVASEDTSQYLDDIQIKGSQA